MPNPQLEYKSLIRVILRGLARDSNEVRIQDVVNTLQDTIIQSYDHTKARNDYKSQWINRILDCAEKENVAVSNAKPSWKAIEKAISQLKTPSYNDENDNQSSAATPATPTTPATPSSSLLAASSSTQLKVSLSTNDKDVISAMLSNLDRDQFWTLGSTKAQAEPDNEAPKSVEEKIHQFATHCNYWHPSQSLIFDTSDTNWTSKFSPFTSAELREIQNYGGPILHTLPDEIQTKLAEIRSLTTASEAYTYGRLIKHDPVTDPLLSWLSITLMTTSKFFVKDNTGEISAMLESDRMYYLWGFISTIFQGTGILAIGKEKVSTANAKARNSKRKLSAVDAIENKKMGHKVDAIYLGSGTELGGLEIGKDNDDTKELKDGMLKLPHVLKDMFASIVNKMPSLLRIAHVLGYNIKGDSVTLLDVDSPNGFITRIRRIKELKYPTCSEDYVSRIVPLLELALQGKMLVDKTMREIRRTSIPLSDATNDTTVLPRSFIPSSLLSSSTSSSSSNSQQSKKQRT